MRCQAKDTYQVTLNHRNVSRSVVKLGRQSQRERLVSTSKSKCNTSYEGTCISDNAARKQQ